MQLAGGVAAGLGFDLNARDDDHRWSARRTLVFVLASNTLLWWMIAYAVWTFG